MKQQCVLENKQDIDHFTLRKMVC